ncbi:hypothetical protein [Variovorax sp. KK3]|uniref:hypothetical protein n=1 Tax=Variovorax sp. KK3 TaxID=1855728 RepID=UPI00117DAF1E|nr:hypothetical protein [Variovorax sp. KK3]
MKDKPPTPNNSELRSFERTLLKQIAEGPWPNVLTGNHNLLAVSKLFHAGYIEAFIRVVFDPYTGMPEAGIEVSEITPSGWRQCLTEVARALSVAWDKASFKSHSLCDTAAHAPQSEADHRPRPLPFTTHPSWVQ